MTLIGWEVAGLAGALVATLAICLPMSVVVYLVYGHWEAFRAARWRQAVQIGVAPLAVGLIFSVRCWSGNRPGWGGPGGGASCLRSPGSAWGRSITYCGASRQGRCWGFAGFV